MARLYANENFPHPVVNELRRLGHDVLTVMETGKANEAWPDDAVLEFAISQDRAVITLNRRHFVRLGSSRHDHAGIIVCSVERDFAAQAARIDAAIKDINDLSGRIVRVNRPNR
ncbi:MAG: DUF5615 family PIN-like protein [Planctomycetes bacterium]|nr:DUF5615 family PIN-like protein [Planctomycetota bacterium]